MKSERRQQIDRLYSLACDLGPGERAAFLEKECSGNNGLREEVESLLARAPAAKGSAAATAPAHHRTRENKQDLVGTTLLHYRVIEKIGEGGMGIVYRAWDEHLRRDVAIKVLPAGTLSDDTARKRFRNEAHALAKLNHPNIASVFDFDSLDGLDFLVMEFVPGTTLGKKLAERPLPEREIIRLTLQLADGMAAAQAQGIVHRDLKPGNLVVTPDGRLKILDFGLATLLRPSGPEETTDSGSSDQGRGGTLAYMSPEQLTDLPVDSRSDIYSTGVILFEMATGAPPFKATLSTALVNDIINKPPPLPRDRRPDLSPRLQEVILKCLEKDSENRYQSAKELLVDLRRLSSPSTPQLIAERPRNRRLMKPWTLAFLVLGLAVAAAGFFWLKSYFRQQLPDYRPYQVTTSAAWEGEPALSPEGNMFAYTSNASGNLDLYVSSVRGSGILRLTKDSAEDKDPSWFPDASAIAYSTERNGVPEIWEVSPLGGGEKFLLSNAESPAISPDGKHIAFCRPPTPDGFLRVGVASLSNPADYRILTDDRDGLWDHNGPAWSPDGKQICYWTRHGLWTVPFAGGPARRLTSGTDQDFNPVWNHTGRYVYFSSYRGGTLAIWRVEVSRDGQPERVTMGTGPESHPTISRDGRRFGYATGMVGNQGVLLERQSGKRSIIPAEEEDFMASVSPIGDRLVFVSGRSSQHQNLWIRDIANGEPVEPPRQITNNPDNASCPAFSPDGRWIAYYRIIGERRDIWITSSMGGPQFQFTGDPANDYQPAWSPDGSQLAFVSERAGSMHIWAGGVKDGKPLGPSRQITFGPPQALSPTWSPDQKLIAFSGFSSERTEVWVVASDGKLPPRQVTRGAGAKQVHWDISTGDILASATWGTDRLELWRVSLQGGTGQRFSPAVEFGSKDEHGLFSISLDGQVLILSRNSSASGHIWILEATDGAF